MRRSNKLYEELLMPDSLTELLDLTKLQDLLDGFCKVTGITAGIVDIEGTLQVSTVRPSLCTRYSDITAAHSRCRFNRLHLLQNSPDQGCSRSGYCPHGLVDVAEPIMLDGKQLGSLVIGQVFLKKPDFDFYCQEAKRCGYDSDEYLKAVSAVPVVSEEQFEHAHALMTGLTSMLAEQAMARHRAEQNENTARLHAERFVREIRRQKMQLQMYAMDDASCSDLLDTLLENTLKLADSSSAYLFEYDENSCLFTLCRWFPPYASQCKIMQPQTVFGLETSGLWGEAVRQRGPVIANPAVAPDTLNPVTPEDHTELVRYLNLPIFSKGRIVASILLGNKDSDYTEEEVRHLQLFLNGAWNLVERCKAEQELKLAKELAENALKIKSELMTSLSHELRTPLNGVIGGSQLLRFTELSAEQDEYLGIVEEASANELMMVNNLLELVQLEADGIHASNSLFSLHSCINEALQVFQGTAHSKGVVLQKELPETMPDMVSGDKARIRQILYSLLGNGVKFTANGTVTLKVDCTTAQDRQILARFIVEDTGIGIAPEKLQYIFEPFVQADMSQTRSFGGLGLGLAICRRLTDALGGTLSVTSDPGKGSSFCLELPLQIVSDRSASIIRPGLQILLAEDDYLSSLAAEALLHAMGHQVITAHNGEEAISKWERGSFDIILLDIHMPIMDGFEALQKIRARARELGRPRTPVIALTAYAHLNYHESFLSADFDGFIAKPVIRSELELTLANTKRDPFDADTRTAD
jgi:two-component system, sensor histidine kinase